VKKEEEEVFQLLHQRFPYSLWRSTVEQISTLQPKQALMPEQVEVP